MSDPYLTAALAIPNLRALWRMNVTGPTADFADASGNGWSLGHIGGTVSSTSTSPIASGDLGAKFSTTGDYFSAPPTPIYLNAISMLTWIKIANTNADTGVQLFGFYTQYGFELGLFRNQVQQSLRAGGGGTNIGTITQNAWVLACVASDGTKCTLRVNGSTVVVSDNTVAFGAEPATLAAARPNGSYEEVEYKDMMVVGRYLTDGELDALYAARLTLPRTPSAGKLSIGLGLSL